MAFCRQCGSNIADNAQFCPACGAPAAAPTTPVYTPPVYTAPVYTEPVPAIKKLAPQPKLNIPCLVILGICLLVWLFVPYISTTIVTFGSDYEYVYDEYWGYWDWEYVDTTSYHYYQGSAGGVVFDLLDGYLVDDLLDDGPFVLGPLFTFIFLSLGVLFTCLKKMSVVRAMGIANTATLGTLAVIQLIATDDLQGATVGFWMIFVGTIVLIPLAKQLFKDPVA